MFNTLRVLFEDYGFFFIIKLVVEIFSKMRRMTWNKEHNKAECFRSPALAAKLRQGNSFQNKGLRKEAYMTKNWDDAGAVTETQSLKHFKVDLFFTQVSMKAKMQ